MTDKILKDPIERSITLHDRTWYGHIIRGHPEMESQKTHVEAAITDPFEIRISLSDSNCRQYYSLENETGLRIVVIVDIEMLLVKTAHFVKKIKGGTLDWSQQTQ